MEKIKMITCIIIYQNEKKSIIYLKIYYFLRAALYCAGVSIFNSLNFFE